VDQSRRSLRPAEKYVDSRRASKRLENDRRRALGDSPQGSPICPPALTKAQVQVGIGSSETGAPRMNGFRPGGRSCRLPRIAPVNHRNRRPRGNYSCIDSDQLRNVRLPCDLIGNVLGGDIHELPVMRTTGHEGATAHTTISLNHFRIMRSPYEELFREGIGRDSSRSLTEKSIARQRAPAGSGAKFCQTGALTRPARLVSHPSENRAVRSRCQRECVARQRMNS
jgi:hypothetical protein